MSGPDAKPHPEREWLGIVRSTRKKPYVGFEPAEVERVLAEGGFKPLATLMAWRDLGWLLIGNRSRRLSKEVAFGDGTRELFCLDALKTGLLERASWHAPDSNGLWRVVMFPERFYQMAIETLELSMRDRLVFLALLCTVGQGGRFGMYEHELRKRTRLLDAGTLLLSVERLIKAGLIERTDAPFEARIAGWTIRPAASIPEPEEESDAREHAEENRQELLRAAKDKARVRTEEL